MSDEQALILELRRALAGLIRGAEIDGMSPIAAELCDAKEALGMTPEQAIKDYREQVDMAAARRGSSSEGEP